MRCIDVPWKTSHTVASVHFMLNFFLLHCSNVFIYKAQPIPLQCSNLYTYKYGYGSLHRVTSIPVSIRHFMMPPSWSCTSLCRIYPQAAFGGISHPMVVVPPCSFILACKDGQSAPLQRCVVYCRCSTIVHIRFNRSNLAKHEQMHQRSCPHCLLHYLFGCMA